MRTTSDYGTRSRVVRWQAGNGLAGVPQAAAPIAFALLALPITGSAESGAVLVLAILAGGRLATTLAGAAVLGFLLPQFGTFYSLSLDRLAPPDRRAEVFALQRTAGSLGVITISALLAVAGLRTALVGGVALLGTALLLAGLHARRR